MLWSDPEKTLRRPRAATVLSVATRKTPTAVPSSSALAIPKVTISGNPKRFCSQRSRETYFRRPRVDEAAPTTAGGPCFTS